MGTVNKILNYIKSLTSVYYYICKFVTKNGRTVFLHETELSQVDYYNAWFKSDDEDTMIIHDKQKNKQSKLCNKDVVEFSFEKVLKREYLLSYSWMNFLIQQTEFKLKGLVKLAIGLPVVITGYLLFVSTELLSKPTMEEILSGSIRMSYILFVMVAISYLIVLTMYSFINRKYTNDQFYDIESRKLTKAVLWHYIVVFVLINLYGMINDDFVKSTYDAIRHLNGLG